MGIIERLRAETGTTSNILWPAFTRLKGEEDILRFFDEYVVKSDYPASPGLSRSHSALAYLSSILHESYDDKRPYFPREVRDRWDNLLIIPTWEKLGKPEIAERGREWNKRQRTLERYLTAWTRVGSLTPSNIRDGVTFYSGKELRDLVTAQFPMELTAGSWELNPDNPTHLLYFSQVPDGTYRLDSKSPEKSINYNSP